MVFFCSFTHLTIPRSPPKFNQFFLVLLRTPPQNFIPIRSFFFFFFFFLGTIVNLLWQIYLIHMKQILYTSHLHMYIHFKDIHVTIYLVYNNYKYSISASMFSISFTLNLVHFSYILKRVINSFLKYRNIIFLFLDLFSKDNTSHSL